MQKVIIEEPYEFIAPHRSRLWSSLFQRLLPWFMKSRYGIVGWDIQGLDRLRASLKAGDGVLLCPNHCRISDPMMMGVICRDTPCHMYAMASWHIFKQSRFESFVTNRIGGFSIYREGVDRQALDTAIDIVGNASRPLVVFPEGVVSFCNDRLLSLMDGVSFIARMAAKKRQKVNPNSRVVVHPVAVRYRLTTGLDEAAGPILSALERQTFWKSHEHKPTRKRIRQLATALLSAREVECLGDTRTGDLGERAEHLMNAILQEQEQEMLGAARTGDVVSRVKDLRTAMLPDLLAGKLDDAERSRRWRQLTDSYYAQCLSMYAKDYLTLKARGHVTAERILETVYRLEEDMTDRHTIQPIWKAEMQVGEAIEVEPGRRKSRNGDPLMANLRGRLLDMLGIEDWWPAVPVSEVAAEPIAVAEDQVA
jgi:1-acyl-sn-glycerol-3-phosphate acyltransferase